MLYSIGYATKPIDVFIQQLQQHSITAVADVRSVPFSKVFYDYHQPAIQKHLRAAGIHYVYLGAELGPRSKDETHYDSDGQVQFDRLRQSHIFTLGIQRLQSGLKKGHRIALMCAEKDPANCHRSLLIGYHLGNVLHTSIQHITHSGQLESQSELEARLPHLHKMEQDLFQSSDHVKDQAYRLQLKDTSYRKP